MAAVNNNPGEPILYASTTKGTMKLVVNGHHFRYSFRKGKYSIFQCCYKENKEECTVRVVTDQKRVYPLGGEHVHFIQATDKSVTAVKFAPGEESEPEQTQSDVGAKEEPAEGSGQFENVLIEDAALVSVMDVLPTENPVDIKLENESTQEPVKFQAESAQVGSIVTLPQPATSVEDANEFREKIKKRLQKALLGKKK